MSLYLIVCKFQDPSKGDKGVGLAQEMGRISRRQQQQPVKFTQLCFATWVLESPLT